MRFLSFLFEKKKKPKPIKFVRFGDLSKTDYKGFFGTEGQHAPPVRKGIYAFMWPYIEDFLWAWKIKKLRKFMGSDEEHDKIFKQEYKKMRKEFTYAGPIWTHFVDEAQKEGLGLAYKGTWVKIHTDDLKYLFEKYKHKDIKANMKMWKQGGFRTVSDPYKYGQGGFMSKDFLEVFIEKIN